jgi:putative nucleotidyltransferase with HDIG domain
VEQAVFILGHQQILHIVLSLAFGGAMSTPLPGYAAEAKELWSHSLTTAVAAETLAHNGLTMEVDPPVAFTAGLLHDIGKLVMNHALTPEVLSNVRKRVMEDGAARVEAERAVLGTNHAEVGGYLLETWHLPEEIIESVRNHHSPVSKPHPRLSVMVHASNCLAHMVGSAIGWESFADRADSDAVSALGITPGNLDEVMLAVHDSSRKVEYFMNLA